jgi:hypothetical protein
MTLKARTFAITGSALWLAGQAVLTWWAIRRDQNRETPVGLDRIGRSLLTTVAGSVIGIAVAFADGFAGGWLSARTYSSIDRMAQAYCEQNDSKKGGK